MLPAQSRALLSAPTLSSTRTAAAWPRTAARCSGVRWAASWETVSLTSSTIYLDLDIYLEDMTQTCKVKQHCS